MRNILGCFGTNARASQNFVPLFLLLSLPFSATLCHAQLCPGAAITSVSPAVWPAGVSTNITITGTGFNPNGSAGCGDDPLELTTSSGPGGPEVFSNEIIVSTTQITATVTPDASDTTQSACLWSWLVPDDVIKAQTNANLVANAAFGAAGSPCTDPEYGNQGITVGICTVPALAAVSPVTPNVWFAGQSYPITITGTGFITPALSAATGCAASTVKLPGYNGVLEPLPGSLTIPVSYTNVASATEITATVAPHIVPRLSPLITAFYGAVGATVEVINIPQGATGIPGAVSLPAPVDVLGAPQIQCTGAAMECNGSTISGPNATAQSVVVGQTITLTTTPTAATLAALPIPLVLTSSTWTAPGTIDSYPIVKPVAPTSTVSTASVNPTVLTNPGLKAYWLYPTPSVPVTYQYCVSGQTTCPEATATFNVTGPTASITSNPPSTSAGTATAAWWVSAPYSGCTLNDGQPTQFLAFGVLFPPPATCIWSVLIPGIAFEATDINLDGVTAPNGGFLWVQIITGGQITGTAPGARVSPFPFPPPGLDSSFPYSAATPTTTSDAPALGLQNNLSTETWAPSYQMYLMWNSNLDPTAIPVPIGYVAWNITGTADQNASASPPWSLAANQVATTTTYTPSTDTGAPNHGLPVWSANVPMGGSSSTQSESVAPDGEGENKQ